MNSAISDLLLTFSIGAATILLGHLATWAFIASRRSFPDTLSKRVSVLKNLPATIAVLLPLSVLFGLGALIRSIECSDCGLAAPLDIIPSLCVLAWVFFFIFAAIFLWALGTWIFWVNRASNANKKKAAKRAGKKRDRSKRMLLRSLVAGLILLLFSIIFCDDENNSDCNQEAVACGEAEADIEAEGQKAAPIPAKKAEPAKKRAAAERPDQRPVKKQGKGKHKPRRR